MLCVCVPKSLLCECVCWLTLVIIAPALLACLPTASFPSHSLSPPTSFFLSVLISTVCGLWLALVCAACYTLKRSLATCIVADAQPIETIKMRSARRVTTWEMSTVNLKFEINWRCWSWIRKLLGRNKTIRNFDLLYIMPSLLICRNEDLQLWEFIYEVLKYKIRQVLLICQGLKRIW